MFGICNVFKSISTHNSSEKVMIDTFILLFAFIVAKVNYKPAVLDKTRNINVLMIQNIDEVWTIYSYICYGIIYAIISEDSAETISYEHTYDSSEKKKIEAGYFVSYGFNDYDEWIVGDCTEFARRFGGPLGNFHNTWEDIPKSVKVKAYNLHFHNLNTPEYITHIRVHYNDGAVERIPV